MGAVCSGVLDAMLSLICGNASQSDGPLRSAVYDMSLVEVMKHNGCGRLSTRRAQRLLNTVGICGCMAVVAYGAVMLWFIVLPALALALDIHLLNHRAFMLFLLVNALGNYLLVLLRGVYYVKRRRRFSKGRKDSHSKIPYRTHYCKLCRQYILKRDHHCFIMGRCIGYHNQKHFVYCMMYTGLGASYSLVIVALYLNLTFGTQFLGAFTFFTLLPSAMDGCFQGTVELQELLLSMFLYACLTATIGSLALFTWQMFIVVMGLTSHEAIRGTKGSQTTVWENWSDTFGKNWQIGIFLPLPLPQYGTGLYEDKQKIISVQPE